MKVDIVQLKIIRTESIEYSTPLTTPDRAFELLRTFIGESDREHCVCVCLDSKNRPTSIERVSIGSLTSSIMHPREVFKSAIISNAHSVIIAHNHPSGDLTPSQEDINMTQRIIEAGRLLGIPLQDHIICTDKSYYSFRENYHDKKIKWK